MPTPRRWSAPSGWPRTWVRGAYAWSGSFVGLATVEVIEDDDRDLSRLSIAPLTFEHTNFDDVPLDHIEFAGIERKWKVAALDLLPD